MKGKESGQYGKDFPARLRLLLDESGTNQNKLAEAIGKTRQTVSLYCVGQAKPDIDALLIIATFFDVTTDWLLGVPGAPMREDKGKRALMGTCGMNEDAAGGLLDLWRMDYQNVMNALFTSPQLIDAANMLDKAIRLALIADADTNAFQVVPQTDGSLLAALIQPEPLTAKDLVSVYVTRAFGMLQSDFFNKTDELFKVKCIVKTREDLANNGNDNPTEE